MARKRPHLRRFLFALLILVLIALLLEINRWLPGGLPGGGGDGGFRERAATAAGTEDGGQAPEDNGALTLTPPGLRPTPEVARDGVVVEVRGADGTWLDYRIGAGGGAVEPPRGKQAGTHALKARHALAGELRVRTKDRAVAHDPRALGAQGGAWVVVMPTAAAKVAGRADRVTLDFAGLESVPPSFETEDVAGERKQHELETSQGVSLPPSKRPVRVRLGSTTARPSSPWYWIHPRDGASQSLAVDSWRTLSIGGGLSAQGVLQEVLGPGGVRVPHRRMGGAEAETLLVNAPKDAELIGRFRVDGADMLVAFWNDFAAMAPGAIPRRTVRVQVSDATGAPSTDSQVVARWTEPAPSARNREPMRLSAVGAATGTAGEYEIRIPARGSARLLVGAPGAQAVSELHHAQPVVKVTLPAGRSAVCGVSTRDGNPIPGAVVWAETLVGRQRVVTRAIANAAGRVPLTGLPYSPVNVFAKAQGYAWGRVLVDASWESASIVLDRGQPLRLLVSNPNGRPLPGVSVDIEAETAQDREVVLPPAPGAIVLTPGAVLPGEDEPNASGGTTGPRGELVVPDLPTGLYTLRLHLDGMHEEVIRKVAPGRRTWFLTLVPRD